MKIVWAIDPFSEERIPYLAISQFLGKFGGAKTVLLPVYVGGAGAAPLRLTHDIVEPRNEGYELLKLRQTLKKYGVVIPDRRVHVLHERKFSLKASADRLVSFAAGEKADLIAVFSHAKGSARRLMLGSFAETLVHRSPISLLVINPRSEVPNTANTILFASDLSRTANDALTRMLKVVAAWDSAKLILFYAAGAPANPAGVTSNLHTSGVTGDARRGIVGDIERALTKAARLAAGRGINVQTAWDDSRAKVSPVILRNARKAKADVVAVMAKAGPVRALFLGSVTRELLRTSPIPVWVVRS